MNLKKNFESEIPKISLFFLVKLLENFIFLLLTYTYMTYKREINLKYTYHSILGL